jgi:type II secretory pathway pseudopilin PulG
MLSDSYNIRRVNLKPRRKEQSSDTTGPKRKAGIRSAFTLVEVMLASSILVMVISASLVVLQMSMRAIDSARYTTLAGQVLQSQMEKLRLLKWSQLTVPQAQTYFTQDVSQTATVQLNRFTTAAGGAATFGQSIVNESATVKVITLTATWRGIDGRSHSLAYTTRYAYHGISDFLYTY